MFGRDWQVPLPVRGVRPGATVQFIRPQDMVIDGDTLYVTDACNHRICVFTTAGQWVQEHGPPAAAGRAQFRFPYGMDMDREGHLVVSEFGNNRVQRIDKATGRGLGTWGARPGGRRGSWPTRGGCSSTSGTGSWPWTRGTIRLQVFSF